jgi:hypothetical protein
LVRRPDVSVAQVTTREPVTAGRTTGRAKRLLMMAVVVAVAASGAFLAWRTLRGERALVPQWEA